MPDGTDCHILPGSGKELLTALQAAQGQITDAIESYSAVAGSLEAVAGGGNVKADRTHPDKARCP